MESHIVQKMLQKAEEAEANGNKERAEYWLKRASEVDDRLKKLNYGSDK